MKRNVASKYLEKLASLPDNTFELRDGDSFDTPIVPGLIELKVLLHESPTREREYLFTWNVIDEITPFSIGFASNEGDVQSQGGTDGTGPDNVAFGFTEDHSDETGMFLALRRKDDPRRWGRYEKVFAQYIGLKEDAAFEIHTGPGTYKVVLETGPVSKWQSARVGINGQEAELRPWLPKALFTVEAEVEAVSGKVRIEGTPGLGFMTLHIEQVEEPGLHEYIDAEQNWEYMVLFDIPPNCRSRSSGRGGHDWSRGVPYGRRNGRDY